MPHQEVQQPDPAKVVSIFERRPAAFREPPITAEEIAEYRQMRPLLMKMLEEWQQVATTGGCPVARQIIHGRK